LNPSSRTRLPTQTPSRAGIISCFGFNPTAHGTFAAGSYAGPVGLFDAGTGALELLLHGHRGGVTQVQFTGCGNYLLTGARGDGDLLCWDVRYASDVVYRLPRGTEATNQRIQFDVEPCGRHLATGGADGVVRFFDLRTGAPADALAVAAEAVSGCRFHPYLPLLATASGERRFPLAPADGGDSSDSEPEAGPSSGGGGAGATGGSAARDGPSNALLVWRLAYDWSTGDGGGTGDGGSGEAGGGGPAAAMMQE
jgi:WD40 repeat protein